MPNLLLVGLAAAMFPGGSPGIYGPPPPAVRTLPATAPSVSHQVGRIRSDIDMARDNGDLTRKQARSLRAESSEIEGLQQRYAQGGITDAEHKELQNRTEVVRAITNAKAAGLIE